MKFLSGKKTFLVSVATTIAAVWLLIVGAIDIPQFVGLIAIAGTGAGLRDAINKA